MPRGRDWSNLASSTRERYERAGITRSAYEGGANLSAARGHATTPEHPGTGKESERYREYYGIRDDITKLKRQIYGRVGKGSIREMKGKSRRQLEKARDALEYMANAGQPWDSLVAEFPEFEADDWDWLKHYH